MILNPSIVCVSALTSVAFAGTLNLPIKGFRTNVAHFKRHEQLLARSMSEIPLLNQLTYYQADLEIGTPPQKISFLIDSATSDTWVMDASNPLCASDGSSDEESIDCTGAIFSPEDSSSFIADEDTEFDTVYLPNNPTTGYYAYDNIHFGDNTLENATIALVTETNSSMAMLGLGPVAGEVTVTNFTDDGKALNTYPNVPVLLKEQGFIESAAFSFWLNDLKAAEGQLLFGGVDHSKYVGTLQLVPIVPSVVIPDANEESEPGLREDFYNREPSLSSIMLHNVYLYDGDGKAGRIASVSVPAVLDTTTSNSYIPYYVLRAIMRSMGVNRHEGLNAYVVDCDLEGGIALDFSGTIITIPFSQFLLPVDGGDMVDVDSGSKKQCLVPLEATYGDVFLLGDVILRSMYIVIDHDNKEVAIANTRFNATDSNVESISDSIPSATSAESYSSTSVTEITTWESLSSGDYTTDLALVTDGNVGNGSVAGRPIPAVTTCVIEGTSGCNFGATPASRSASRSTSRRSTTLRSSSARSSTARSSTARSSTTRSSRVRSSALRSSAGNSNVFSILPIDVSTSSDSVSAEEATTAGEDVASASASASPSASLSATAFESAAASTSATASASATAGQGNAGTNIGVGAVLALPLAIMLAL